MDKFFRGFLAVLLGVVVGIVAIMALLVIGSKIVPPPNLVDVTSNGWLKAYLHLIEPKHFLFPFFAHALGTLGGSFIAGLLAPNKSILPPYIVSVLLLVGHNFYLFVAIILFGPIWFSAEYPVVVWLGAVDLLFAYLPAAWMGSSLAKQMKSKRSASDKLFTPEEPNELVPHNSQVSLFTLCLLYSFVFGLIFFWLGFNGPLTPDGNLGPLMGFFVSGPAGALIGLVAGIIHSALGTKERNIKAELSSLIIVLIISQIFYDFTTHGLNFKIRVVPISIQILVVITGYYLFYGLKKYRCTHKDLVFINSFLIAGTLIIFVSLFPPVTRPWWAPEAWKKHWTTKELPLVAYAFDNRFDASQHIPEFAIDRKILICEWLAIIAITGLGGYCISKRQMGA